ncbi:MAG TPA: HAD family hydrolase [Pyrinomonadaceae bacterium]|nr:HAD family hydrolase [Pyrinomonadaceae bacterium]
MQELERRRAAFIDRDGTLIEEVNFLSRVEDLRIFPYTADALTLLKDAGFLLIVVTNQSGIGRRIYDEAAMHAIHDAMQAQLGDVIDGFYFCPHLPCDGCSCRKPGLGMIESASADFPIELSGSWMIGDKKIDVETGRNAGISSAMVMTGYGRTHFKMLDDEPEVTAEDLLEAVRAIVR